MVRIDGHNRHNRQNKKTTLADRRKAQNHKSLEVGQTITAPTGDPKLRERTTTIDFSQQQPVVTNPQVTTENIEQAIARAGSKAGNKGYDCAMGAIEMVNLIDQF